MRPWWLLSHLAVAALLVATVNLGFWQFRRLEERREHNALVEERAEVPVASLEEVLVGMDPDELVYRTVEVSGVFDARGIGDDNA